jgi:hypothetical protein
MGKKVQKVQGPGKTSMKSRMQFFGGGLSASKSHRKEPQNGAKTGRKWAKTGQKRQKRAFFMGVLRTKNGRRQGRGAQIGQAAPVCCVGPRMIVGTRRPIVGRNGGTRG